MRTDWFADLAPSPVVPGPSPVTGDAGNRSAMRVSPVSSVVPGPEQETERDEPVRRRMVLEYRLADGSGRWLTLLGAPGESYESAADGLRRRYGDRLIEVRPYKGAKR